MKTFQTYGNRKDQALTAFDSDNKGELFSTIRCNPVSGYIVQKSANGPIVLALPETLTTSNIPYIIRAAAQHQFGERPDKSVSPIR